MVPNERWLEISRLASEANAAYEALETALRIAEVKHPEEAELLRKIQRRFTPAMELGFLSYMTQPQAEWIGGDAFKTRQPHIVHDTWTAPAEPIA